MTRQFRFLRPFGLAAVLMVGAEKTANAAPGDIYNLGTLGGTSSYGWAINNAGQVAGSTFLIEDNYLHAFRYTGIPGSGGIMVDLGNTIGGPSAGGRAINDAGQITGEASVSGAVAHAFRYTGTPGSGGAMVDLGTLGGTRSAGNGINDAEQITGSAAMPDQSNHAFRYTGTPGSGGAMVDLGTLGGTYSLGYAINNAGQVTGYGAVPGDDQYYHASRYSGTPGAGGAMEDLGTLGGTFSIGYGINEAGQVTGEANTIDDAAAHAFRYTGTPGAGGVMTDLGTLGGTNSIGNAINEAGLVVGRAERSAFDGGWATLWLTDAANTAVDLDAWIDAVNPTQGAYWTLNLPFAQYGINDNGLISGTGYYDDGPNGLTDGIRAFILDVSSLVPEPSSLALLACGAAALAVRRNRRITNLLCL